MYGRIDSTRPDQEIRISSFLLPEGVWWVQDPENPIWILGEVVITGLCHSPVTSSILVESEFLNRDVALDLVAITSH